MECATCGFDVPAGNKFCLQCGTPVSAVSAPAPVGDKSARRCPQCGAEAAESQKFCQRCGAVLAAEVAAPSRAEGKPASSVGIVLLIVAGLAVLIAGGYLGYRYLANRAAPGAQTEAPVPAAQSESSQAPTARVAPPSTPKGSESSPAATAPPQTAAPPVPRAEAPAPSPVTSAQPAVPAKAEAPPEPPRRERGEVLRPESAPVVAHPATPQVSAPEAPPAKPAYSGPASGTISWSGQLEKEGLVTIDGGRASTGSLRGELPGVPVMVEVSPTDVGVAESPGPQNGWKRLVLRSRVRRQSVVNITWRVLR